MQNVVVRSTFAVLATLFGITAHADAQVSKADAERLIREIAAQTRAQLTASSPFSGSIATQAAEQGILAARAFGATHVMPRTAEHDDEIMIVGYADQGRNSVVVSADRDAHSSVRFERDHEWMQAAQISADVTPSYTSLIRTDSATGRIEVSSRDLGNGVYAIVEGIFAGVWTGPRAFHQHAFKLISTRTGKTVSMSAEEYRALTRAGEPEPVGLASKLAAVGEGIEAPRGYVYRLGSFRQGRPIAGGLMRRSPRGPRAK